MAGKCCVEIHSSSYTSCLQACSGPDSGVVLVILGLAELLVVREANVAIWNGVSSDVLFTVG